MKKPVTKKGGKPKMKTPGRNLEICPGDVRIDLKGYKPKKGGR